MLALGAGDLELEGGGLAGAVAAGEGAGAPGGAAVDLVQVGHEGEGLGVAEGDVDDAVVGESGHGGDGGGFLAAAHGGGGDEETGHLAPEAAAGPEAAGLVPESLDIGVSFWFFSLFTTCIEIKKLDGEKGETMLTSYLPLGREVAVTSGNADEEGIVLLQCGRIFEDGDVGSLGGSAHLGEHFIG